MRDGLGDWIAQWAQTGYLDELVARTAEVIGDKVVQAIADTRVTAVKAKIAAAVNARPGEDVYQHETRLIRAVFAAHDNSDDPLVAMALALGQQYSERAEAQVEGLRQQNEALRKQVDAAESKAAAWMLAWGELDGLLEQAAPHICSLCCPSVWKDADHPEGIPHCPLCIAITNRATTPPADMGVTGGGK